MRVSLRMYLNPIGPYAGELLLKEELVRKDTAQNREDYRVTVSGFLIQTGSSLVVDCCPCEDDTFRLFKGNETMYINDARGLPSALKRYNSFFVEVTKPPWLAICLCGRPNRHQKGGRNYHRVRRRLLVQPRLNAVKALEISPLAGLFELAG